MSSLPFRDLHLDAFGRLVLTDLDGATHVGVTPVRAHPISAPDEGLSLVGVHGHELAWVERLSALPDGPRRLLEAELAAREFHPTLKRLISVNTFATPSTWRIETDREAVQAVRIQDLHPALPGGQLVVQILIQLAHAAAAQVELDHTGHE